MALRTNILIGLAAATAPALAAETSRSREAPTAAESTAAPFALRVEGLEPAFRADRVEYRVAPNERGLVPITAAVEDRALQLLVDGRRLEPGRTTHVEARPGARLRVDVLRDGRPLTFYMIDILDLQPTSDGALYVTGGKGVMRVDLDDGSVTEIAIPGSGETSQLARGGDHQRLYVTSSEDHLLTAIDLATRTVADQLFGGEDWIPGAVAVMPGDLRVHTADVISPVLTTFDTADLGLPPAVDFIPFVAMPQYMMYRPGFLDLYISDFWAGPEQVAVRRPWIDWVKGTFGFGWAAYDMPPSQTNDDGDAASGMGFLPAQGFFVAANTRGDEMVVFDEATRKPLATAPVAAMPMSVTVDPDSDANEGRFFVTSYQGWTLSVFRVTSDGAGGAKIALEQAWDPCENRGDPVKAVFGDDPDRLHLLCDRSVVVTLDADTLEVEDFILTGDDATERRDMVWAKQ